MTRQRGKTATVPASADIARTPRVKDSVAGLCGLSTGSAHVQKELNLV